MFIHSTLESIAVNGILINNRNVEANFLVAFFHPFSLCVCACAHVCSSSISICLFCTWSSLNERNCYCMRWDWNWNLAKNYIKKQQHPISNLIRKIQMDRSSALRATHLYIIQIHLQIKFIQQFDYFFFFLISRRLAIGCHRELMQWKYAYTHAHTSYSRSEIRFDHSSVSV